MNKTIDYTKTTVKHKQGDIFSDGDDFYILASYDGRYAAICFKDGAVWDKISIEPKMTVDGLTFVGRNLTIVLKNEKKEKGAAYDF